MKNIILFIFVLHSFNLLNAQEVSVSNARLGNRVVIGLENPINIVVENKKCGSFFVTTNNGTITGGKCWYVMVPNRLGEAKIFVKQIKGKDTIILKAQPIIVERLPLPEAFIGAKKGGPIKKAELIAIGGVITRACCDIDAPIKLDSYRIFAIRNKEILFANENMGNRFTDSTKMFLQKLEAGDELFITNIIATCPDVSPCQLKSLAYVIEKI